MIKALVCMSVLFVGCQNIEQLDTLEEGVGGFTKDVSQIPKIIIRDALDIEENEEKSSSGSESVDEKIKKLEDKVKELEKEKDDASKDLEDIYDKLECANEANGLAKVQKCLE